MPNTLKLTESTIELERPVLSLILCSRNDQYMGDSVWRLQTTLNYIVSNVKALGKENAVEVLVADWGSEIPLREVVKLQAGASRIVSFLAIPPLLAKDLQGDSPFPEVLALNAVARRAKGEFIGRIDQDVLVGKHFLKTFFELYTGKRQLDVTLKSVMLFANRRRIPYEFAVRCPPFAEIVRCITWFGKIMRVENLYSANLFYFSFVGMWLLHRNLWDECGGYDERLIYMNEMESDMVTRLLTRHPMVDLGKLVHHDFYHLEHYSRQSRRCPSSFRKVNPAVDYARTRVSTVQPNGDNWGLVQYPLELLPYITRTGDDVCAGQTLFARMDSLYQLILAGLFAVLDRFLHPLSRARAKLSALYSVWKHRAKVSRAVMSGQSLTDRPQALIRFWIERRSRGLLREKKQLPR
jgi:hypothetical protein